MLFPVLYLEFSYLLYLALARTPATPVVAAAAAHHVPKTTLFTKLTFYDSIADTIGIENHLPIGTESKFLATHLHPSALNIDF